MTRNSIIAMVALASFAGLASFTPHAVGSVAEAQACETAPQFTAHRSVNSRVRAQYSAVSRGEWLQAIHFGNEVVDSGAAPSAKAAAYTNLCYAYAATGAYDEALEACNSALERDDDAWRALNNRGAAQWLAGDHVAASSDFQAAAAIEEGEEEVIANLTLAQCS